ncbi:RloB family protein [Thermoanaerobacterium sp. RBIITD]|uniref:RloB family protein n=1 Tax=Thermoanaerobacterium sp. RBIITD TaxID=1550240 RepID=UPI000BBF768E|nr:RloB family protein [Thermoanaerobacterium sp. RBIITD]SNX53709.1 RloB-like protein [Thermoanaerobacterium sp. RBIITD]
MGSDREELFKKRRRHRRERKENAKKRAPNRYLIVCEGKKTEPNYFEGIKRKINEQYSQSVRVEEQIEMDIEGTGRNTNDLVSFTEYIINRSVMPYGHVWVIFDKDSFSDDQFNSAIEQAHSKGYQTGWSNEAIELWFLLHFEYLNAGITREQYCEKLTRYFKQFGIGKYEKNMKDIFELLTQYGNVDQAIKWSEKLLKMHEEIGNMHSKAKMKPATTVFELVRELRQYF